MLSEGHAEALVDAINENTRQVRLLREQLCGRQITDRPGGSLGEFVAAMVSETFHGRSGKPQ